MRFASLILALLATTVGAQTFPPAGAPPFDGGSATNPFLAPDGCTNPGFSFTSDATEGLCRTGTTMYLGQDPPTGDYIRFTNDRILGLAGQIAVTDYAIFDFDGTQLDGSFKLTAHDDGDDDDQEIVCRNDGGQEGCQISVNLGSSNGQSRFAPTFNEWNFGLTRTTFNVRPVAGASGEVTETAVTVAAMDGSDEVNVVNVAITNANHTGAGNVLNAIKVASITGDPDAEETALRLEDGYDSFLAVEEGADVASFKLPVLTASRDYEFPDTEGVVLLNGPGMLFLKDDFVPDVLDSGETGELGWQNIAAALADVPATAGHPGLMRLTADGVATAVGALYLAGSTDSGVIVATDVERMTFILQVDQITDIEVRIGILENVNGPTTNMDDGVYFDFTPATSANWRTITESADTTTINTTSTAVATGTYYRFDMVQLTSGNWEFYLDGTLEFTHSTNLPTVPVSPTFSCEKSTAVDRSLLVDYFSLQSVPLSR